MTSAQTYKLRKLKKKYYTCIIIIIILLILSSFVVINFWNEKIKNKYYKIDGEITYNFFKYQSKLQNKELDANSEKQYIIDYYKILSKYEDQELNNIIKELEDCINEKQLINKNLYKSNLECNEFKEKINYRMYELIRGKYE